MKNNMSNFKIVQNTIGDITIEGATVVPAVVYPDQVFLENTVKFIASHPDEVRVERTIDERGVLLTIFANREDYGQIIGRNGAMANALRTILKVIGSMRGAFIRMWLHDDGYVQQETIKREYIHHDISDSSI